MHRDVLTLPTLKQYVYLALIPGGGRLGTEVVEARLNVMHGTFLTLQSSPYLDDDLLVKGFQVFQTLFTRHFTETLQVH